MAIIDPDSDQRVPLDHDLSLLYAKEVSDWNAAECEHNEKELRRGFNKGGGPIVQLQCLACGKQIGKLEKRTPETDALNEIDQELGRVDKRDSPGAVIVIQAGICNGDQRGTKPDVERRVGVL